MKLQILVLLVVVFLSWQEFAFLMIRCGATQIDNLNKLIESRNSENPPHSETWPELDVAVETLSSLYTSSQDGLKEADKIDALPGQPQGVDFSQYAGYVPVEAGRALFYYFVESPQNASTKPLVLWLNGGPGCSSFGYGAMLELGPFRVKNDSKSLYRNDYSWNQVANVLFLESPFGVGFSYSNRSFDYLQWGDKITAADSYTFLINWFKRFPQYKDRDFYIMGENYAGHYVPQLAYNIIAMNKKPNEAFINLKGITIGNAFIDDNYNGKGMYDFFWTHALNSDETHANIDKTCDYQTGNYSFTCLQYQFKGLQELGSFDFNNNLYAPSCNLSKPFDSIQEFDPCSGVYVTFYLNRAEVQQALHARPNTTWALCSESRWGDSPKTILPLIKQLIASGIRIWIYSGDIDGRGTVTSSRYIINSLNLPIEIPWRPWYTNQEVGGYVIGYKGLVFTTVKGAGHQVSSDQPQRALTVISSFLQGKLPPPLNDGITR